MAARIPSCFNHLRISLLCCCFLLFSLLPLPALSRPVPTSPLSDEKVKELVHEKAVADQDAGASVLFLKKAMLSHGSQVSHVAALQVKDGWKLRSLWVSVIGKEPSIITSSSPSPSSSSSSSSTDQTETDFLSHDEVTHAALMSPNETIVEEARQVPGGPDPLHHSNQPPSP